MLPSVFFLLLCSTFLYVQTLLDESFNGPQFPPEGWNLNSKVSGQHTWHNYPSQNFGAVIRENQLLNQNEWLITPVVDLQDYPSLFLVRRKITGSGYCGFSFYYLYLYLRKI